MSAPNPVLDRPDKPGNWIYWRDRTSMVETVKVEQTVASGLFCKELKMGGSAQCGFRDWAGEWRYDGA